MKPCCKDAYIRWHVVLLPFEEQWHVEEWECENSDHWIPNVRLDYPKTNSEEAANKLADELNK